MKIVLIESNEKILAKWENTFSDLAYTCEKYHRAYQAIAAFDKGDALPDILVMGLDLPIMNGEAYIQAQINSFRFYKGPLLLVLPSSLPSIIFKTTNVNHHLITTDDMNSLVEKVESILKAKSMFTKNINPLHLESLNLYF